MKEMYSFLSRSLACLMAALVILSVLAMPTQGVRANDPSQGGGNSGGVPCGCAQDFDWDCSIFGCYGDPSCPIACSGFTPCDCPT
jgi:hypothetical protein